MALYGRQLAVPDYFNVGLAWCYLRALIMAKKTAKSTREQVYREILERAGIRFEDCTVLGFAFEYQMQTELFHYGLMAEKTDYFVFDCWGKYANVVAPKDEQDAAIIIAVAAKNGGKKITPILR